MAGELFNNGRVVRGINPRDPTRKVRLGIVLWSHEDRALVIFAQTFETGEGHYFELKHRPGGFLRHDSYFYLTDVAVLRIQDLTWTPLTLGKGEYRQVRDFFAKHEASLLAKPPPGVPAIWSATPPPKPPAPPEHTGPSDPTKPP